ncbi:MAG: hypothetical protein ACPGPA_09280, partial [Alphaproteobacteria bacterium]
VDPEPTRQPVNTVAVLRHYFQDSNLTIAYLIAVTRSVYFVAVFTYVPMYIVGAGLDRVGGVGELDHFVDGIQEGKANAVLAASVFHFGTFSIGQVKAHMAQAGIPMRELKNP